jgi:hypothetical protein
MPNHPALDPTFRGFLLRILDLSERQLDKVASELLFHWSETVEEYVARRHRELQRQGVPNRTLYGLVAAELEERPFRAEPRTERQIRRMIYG